MAEETQTPASEAPAAAEVEKPVVKEPPQAATEEEVKKPETKEEPAAEVAEKEGEAEKEEDAMPQSSSFKEETNVVADLVDPEKKALEELKQLIHAALANNEFSKPPAPAPKAEERAAEKPKEPKKPEEAPAPAKEEEEKKEEEPAKVAEDDGAKTVEAIEETVVPVAAATAETEEEKAAPPPPPKEVLIWGVPLLGGGEKSDTALLKFLRARDFKVKDALAMIKNTVIWREEFGIEGLLEEDLGVPKLEKVVYMHGQDREGHPVCYNVYGEFQDKELYQKALGDGERRKNFLRWRVQVLEKGIRELLDFSADGVCTMVQVTDLKNSPGPGKKELRQATKQALALLQDNYPEFVAKQVFINVPWWYMAVNRMISPFLTQRTKSKFVFAGPGKSAETLSKYIAPEQIPVQYGGLSTESDTDFTTSDAVNEIAVKPSAKHVIEIPVSETCIISWELRVLGWEVSYGAEFVPDVKGGYAVIVQKMRRFSAVDEAVVRNSFKVGEPGKIVLTVDNAASKKKKLLYRFNTKNSSD